VKVKINGVETEITKEQAKALNIKWVEETEKGNEEKEDKKPTDKGVDDKEWIEKFKKEQREQRLRETIAKAKDTYGFEEDVIREKILPTMYERNLSIDEVVAIKKAELSDETSFNEFFGLTGGKEGKPELSGPKSDEQFRTEGLAAILNHGNKIKDKEM
jgi:hypothetical protein